MSLIWSYIEGRALSFIYEAFGASEYLLIDIKRGLYEIYKYVRKSDDEYLTYMDGLSEKADEFFKNNYNAFMRHVIKPKIALGNFEGVDAQSGVSLNSQVFQVETKDVKMYLKKDIDVTFVLIVGVFGPAKTKRDHNDYVIKKQDIFENCQRAYLCEKHAYEKLVPNFKSNSAYITQKSRFFIGSHYHALEPYIILKYLAQEENTLLSDKETYEKSCS